MSLRLSILGAATLVVAASAPASAQSWRTIASARQLHGEEQLTVHVQYGAGRFRVTPGSAGELYRMDMRYDEDRFIPVREFNPGDGTLRLGLRSRDGAGLNVSLGDRRKSDQVPTFDLQLSPEIPLSLEMELGAVEADVDLGGVALQRLSYRTGASETHLRFGQPNPVACEELTIEAGAAQFEASSIGNANCAKVTFRGGVGEVTLDFSGTWRRSMTADVNVGLGHLDLRLPRDVGVSVQLNRFLASFDAAGFEKRGNMYFSENYNTARYRITLNVNASFGGVEVAWLNQ